MSTLRLRDIDRKVYRGPQRGRVSRYFSEGQKRPLPRRREPRAPKLEHAQARESADARRPVCVGELSAHTYTRGNQKAAAALQRASAQTSARLQNARRWPRTAAAGAYAAGLRAARHRAAPTSRQGSEQLRRQARDSKTLRRWPRTAAAAAGVNTAGGVAARHRAAPTSRQGSEQLCRQARDSKTLRRWPRTAAAGAYAAGLRAARHHAAPTSSSTSRSSAAALPQSYAK